MGKCNLSVREQKGGRVRGVAEGVRWASVICLSVREQKGGAVGGVAEGLVVI